MRMVRLSERTMARVRRRVANIATTPRWRLNDRHGVRVDMLSRVSERDARDVAVAQSAFCTGESEDGFDEANIRRERGGSGGIAVDVQVAERRRQCRRFRHAHVGYSLRRNR